MLVKAAAHQEDYLPSIQIQQLRDPGERHAAPGRGKDGLDWPHGCLGAFDDADALLLAKRETPTVIGVNAPIGACQAGDLPEQGEVRYSAVCADDITTLQGGMADDRHGHPVITGDPVHRVQPCNTRQEHQSATASRARIQRPFQDLIGRAGNVGHVDAAHAGLTVGFLHCLGTARHPLAEWRKRLVCQAVIIFDDIDAAQGELVGQVGQRFRGQPHRLNGRAQQGA